MIKPFLYWEGKIALIYAFLQYIIFVDGKGWGSCKIIHSESYFFLLKKLLNKCMVVSAIACLQELVLHLICLLYMTTDALTDALTDGYMRHKTTALCVRTNNPGLFDA